jgi:hypothetical protein
MITSFFKPNSQKVRPVSSSGSTGGGPSEPNKRELEEDTKKETASNKRSKLGESSTSKAVNSEAQELLTYLDRHESDETTWREVLEKHFSSPSFERLAKFVSQQR